MASGGVDVAVPGDSLGDVRWHAVQHGVGDENLWKSWGVNRSGRPLGSVTPVPLSARVIQSRSVPPGMGAVLETEPALEQQGHGRVPHPFVGVVGRDTTQRPVVAADRADDRGEDIGEFGADHQQPFRYPFSTARCAATERFHRCWVGCIG
jgi:hypothetical protein